MQERLCLDSSAQYLKGVGPKVYKLLNKLDIYTIKDLLYYFPFRYEDRRDLKSINKLTPGKLETVQGEIIAVDLRKSWRKRMSIFQCVIRDKTGTVCAIWFNQPYLKDYIKKGENIILYGKVEQKGHLLQINSPEFEIINDKENFIHTGRIVPIYSLTKNLNQKRLRRVFYNLINSNLEIYEYLPAQILKTYNFIPLSKAIREIHFPSSRESLLRARKRLVFDEFFLLQILVAVKKERITNRNKGIVHKLKKEEFHKLANIIPFNLTVSQRRVIKEITQDMCGSYCMNRLLQGDVGSGKTVVTMFASLLSLSNGHQVAIMVPTEILAMQHFRRFKYFFNKLNYGVDLLISSLGNKECEKVRDKIQRGKAELIIGTHSLVQEKVKFADLGLVVIDEQHRFGVLQRSKLKCKGVNPDVLVMTATPIPRTLTMTLYGDMEVSVIDTLPPGRKNSKTFWIKDDKKDKAYSFLKKKIKQGRQCYIVCPLIEESENMDLKSAIKLFDKLTHKIFSDFQVGLLHGRMNWQDRDKVLERFLKNRINILVTTSIIEVGIDIPNASVLMVEDSHRFGLSQLHQLRGRISRSCYQPYCILVSNNDSPDVVKRLKSLVNTTDGFKIAESDLKLRGPGEFAGTRQHGITEFDLADIVRDFHLLKLARKEAFDLIKNDPTLEEENHIKIKQKLRSKYKKKDLEIIGA